MTLIIAYILLGMNDAGFWAHLGVFIVWVAHIFWHAQGH
jgi:hypothetical protein